MIGTYVELRDQALRVENALRQVLERQEAWHCNRVWDAWSVGTMTQDDFSLVTEDPVAVEELVQAATSAMARATVPDSATGRVAELEAHVKSLKAALDGREASPQEWSLLGRLEDATAAVERVRALVTEWKHEGPSGPFPDRIAIDVGVEVIEPLLAALDGAPEPEVKP